jgi:hypothetical protein
MSGPNPTNYSYNRAATGFDATNAVLRDVWRTDVQEGGTLIGGMEVGAMHGMSGMASRTYPSLQLRFSDILAK